MMNSSIVYVDPVPNYPIAKPQQTVKNPSPAYQIAKKTLTYLGNILINKECTPAQKIELLNTQMDTLQQEYLKIRSQLENDFDKQEAIKALLTYLEKNKNALDKLIQLSERVAQFKKNVALSVSLETPQRHAQLIPHQIGPSVESLQHQVNLYTNTPFVVDNFPPTHPEEGPLHKEQAKQLQNKLQNICDQLVRHENQEFLKELQKQHDQVDQAMRKTPPLTTEDYLNFPDAGYHLRCKLEFELDKNLIFLKESFCLLNGMDHQVNLGENSYFSIFTTYLKNKIRKPSNTFENLLMDFKNLAKAADKARKIHLLKQEKVKELHLKLHAISDKIAALMNQRTTLLNPPSSPISELDEIAL